MSVLSIDIVDGLDDGVHEVEGNLGRYDEGNLADQASVELSPRVTPVGDVLLLNSHDVLL